MLVLPLWPGDTVKLEAEALIVKDDDPNNPPAFTGAANTPANRHTDTDISTRFFMMLGPFQR